ncbi:MAG: glycosyltransferase family 39 protein [Parcubacteria group bacterium]|nr:glycosyltransferase family 39 protein [Parcubacteria group bacterium]
MLKKIKNFIWSKNFILLLIILLALALRLNALTFMASAPVPSFAAEATPINTALRLLENRTLSVNMATNNYQPLLSYANAVVYAFAFAVSLLLGIFENLTEMKAFFISDRSSLILLSRILVGLISTASVYFLHKATKRLFNKTVGLIAAFLFAIELLSITVSHTANVWIPMLFFLILAFDQAVRVLKTGRIRAYLLAALFAGLSYGSHLVGGIAIIPLIAAHFLRQAKILSERAIFDRRLIVSGILFMLFVGLFFALNPMALLWEFQGSYVMEENGFGIAFEKPLEVFYYPFKFLFSLHPMLSILSLLGILLLLKNKDYKKCLLVLSLPFLYYLYISPLSFAYQPRFFVILTPFLLILSSYAIFQLVDIVKMKSKNLKKILLLAAVILISLPSFYFALNWSLYIRQGIPVELAENWINGNIPTNSKILLKPHGDSLFLEQNKEYISFVEKTFGESTITQRQNFLWNLADWQYPQPAFFVLDVASVPNEKWGEILEEHKFDYYIHNNWGIKLPTHELVDTLKEKELIKEFKMSDEITTYKLFEKIPGMHGARNRSSVEIYKLNY